MPFNHVGLFLSRMCKSPYGAAEVPPNSMMSEGDRYKDCEAFLEARRGPKGLAEGWKFGLPWHGTAPDMTSRQKSAGFSFGGRSKPREVKYGMAAVAGPRKTVLPCLPRKSTS